MKVYISIVLLQQLCLGTYSRRAADEYAYEMFCVFVLLLLSLFLFLFLSGFILLFITFLRRYSSPSLRRRRLAFDDLSYSPSLLSPDRDGWRLAVTAAFCSEVILREAWHRLWRRLAIRSCVFVKTWRTAWERPSRLGYARRPGSKMLVFCWRLNASRLSRTSRLVFLLFRRRRLSPSRFRRFWSSPSWS